MLISDNSHMAAASQADFLEAFQVSQVEMTTFQAAASHHLEEAEVEAINTVHHQVHHLHIYRNKVTQPHLTQLIQEPLEDVVSATRTFGYEMAIASGSIQHMLEEILLRDTVGEIDVGFIMEQI
jgi:phosphoserine phosphatase